MVRSKLSLTLATTRAGVDFNARGVTGYVSFTETSEGDIAINTFFTGLQSEFC